MVCKVQEAALLQFPTIFTSIAGYRDAYRSPSPERIPKGESYLPSSVAILFWFHFKICTYNIIIFI